MPVLHLICGLPGSGKTTFAKELEHRLPALRLAPDEWMARIVGDGFDEAKRAAVEAVQWEIAARAAALGADTKLHFLDVSRDELLRRLERRNAILPPDTFPVTAAQIDRWWSWFEPPGLDELE